VVQAGANVNDASKGRVPCCRPDAADPTPLQVLQHGTQAADGEERLERLATRAVVPHAGAQVRRDAGGAGVFADVVDVDDTVQISLAPVAEKARSFTS